MSAVVFVLQREDGQVLVEYRPETDHYFPRQWVFPGGKVKPPESPWSAMVREVGEELGVNVWTSYVLDVGDLRYADPGQAEAFHVDAFLIRDWQGELPSEVLDTGYPLGWVTLDEALQCRSGCVGPIARAVANTPMEPRP